MTVESPLTLDLTQDIAPQTETHLTPEEQASYQAYLDSLQAQERQAVISLTQQDLVELKSILTNFDPRANQAGKTIAEFTNQQISEDFSSSDILAGVESNLLSPEMLDAFDTLSQELLFGEKGMFQGLHTSDTAQEIASSSFSLALIKRIKTQPELLDILLTAIKTGDALQIENALKSYGGENITSLGEYFKQMSLDTRNQFELNGDQNKIFMDMQIGTDFFTKVLSGEITPTNVRTLIEAQNSETPLKAQIGDIALLQEMGNLTQKDIDALKVVPVPIIDDQTPAVTGVPDTQTSPPIVSDPEAETAAETLATMKPLGPFLAAILEFLKGITSLSQTTPEAEDTQSDSSPTLGDTKPDGTDTAREGISETPTVQLIELFEGLENNFPAEKASILEELRGNPELTIRMVNALEGISSSENMTQSFNNLFGSNGTNGKAGEVFQIFETAGFTQTLPEGTSQTTRITYLIEEYTRYRNSPGVVNQTENRITWSEYAETRKKEGWVQTEASSQVAS